MSKEQPLCDMSGYVSEESNVVESADSTVGSLNKFKDLKSLEEAYVNLQSEFTRKCQRLNELEKDNLKANTFNPLYETPEWKQMVGDFVAKNPTAQNFASEIYEVLLSDKVLASSPNSLELAFEKVKASKYIPEEDLVNDESFLEKYILNNEKVKKVIIDNYLKDIKQNKSPQLINSSKTGSLGITPNKIPGSLSEARAMAVKILSK